MATFRVTQLKRELQSDEASFRARRPHPWVVVSPGDLKSGEKLMISTSRGLPAFGLDPDRWPAGQQASDRWALSVERGPTSSFGLGISIGRNDSNDVVLPDTRISRFHAYFQQTPRGWALGDADSANGTAIDGVKLGPGEVRVLPAEAVLTFGELEARYFDLDRFIAFLRNA